MKQDETYDDRATTPSLGGVPRQSPPPKVPRSLRLRPKLLEQVEERSAEEGLTFNAAVERALEEWVKK